MLDSLKYKRWLKKYLRYTDYIGAAQLYLKDNFLLKEKLEPQHIKERILGHWGTVPGLNFIYANLNYLVSKYDCEMLVVTGPGHGAPAILANVYAEKTLNEFYKEYTLNEKGLGKLIRDFSWPHSNFPSHVTPSVPGSILEGGELGYSLSTAFGAVMDNPNLIVAAIIGDGEAESGPLAAAWHSNKFLNPKTCGAVLPIVHVNGFKISNTTIYATMSDKEIKNLFEGYGYEVLIVDGGNLETKMRKAVEDAYKKIRKVQILAREKDKVMKPKWPVIILRSPKGWRGVKQFKGKKIEGSFKSHGIPLDKLKTDPAVLEAVEKWLKSYKVNDLLDANGTPKKEVLRYVPTGKNRIGMNKHAIGGNIIQDLKLPSLKKYAIKIKDDKRGKILGSNMIESGKMLRDVFKLNKRTKNFRVMCPDELESNKMSAIFEATQRGYMWPVSPNTEHTNPEGRVSEMLSEHTLQGWLQGYILTGRHGIFATYEAFATIISSMVDQYAKFLKQSFKVKWRKPVASSIYVLTSNGWRQDHNGYSHQNPSFASNILQKHGEFCQVYYPSDINSTLVAFEESLKRKNFIAVIVAGKTELPQWLTLEEAREQAKKGVGVWEWVGGKEATKKPDVVLASAGDYMTTEALLAVKICREIIPEMKIRYVNVSELTSIAIGDYSTSHYSKALSEKEFEKYFTADKPVVFNYHGYVSDMEHILWPYKKSERFSLHGYQEHGSTTTPFDMTVSNQVSRFHLVIDMVEQASKNNKAINARKKEIVKMMQTKLSEHRKYIEKYGDDPEELKDLTW